MVKLLAILENTLKIFKISNQNERENLSLRQKLKLITILINFLISGILENDFVNGSKLINILVKSYDEN